jgi:alkyldihydroxyacetonephosphate synthase
MLLLGITGSRDRVRQARRAAITLVRQHGGIPTGQTIGRAWRKSRFLTPYLRNTLWEAGYAVDTLETAIPWSQVMDGEASITHSIRDALAGTGERVYVFAHLSHLYRTGASVYVTYIFRTQPDPDQTIEHWALMKRAASQAVVALGGTISHQHGVGADHAPYLPAEKGQRGMELLRALAAHCDPDGILNPGKLLGETRRMI